MKKEVQALIKRRRARLFPAVMAAMAGIILIALILLIVMFGMASSRIREVLQTSTPTASLTATARPSNTPPPATETPAATATQTATAGPSPTPTQNVYVVQEGDNLFTIAEQFKANVCLMMAINNLQTTLLSPGQSLIIPAGDEELPTATALPTGLPRGARLEYVVQCGDTLDSIAAQFNSTGDDIAKTNDIDDPLSIQIGQVVIVRVNIATPTPTATFTVTPAAPAATAGPTTAPATGTP